MTTKHQDTIIRAQIKAGEAVGDAATDLFEKINRHNFFSGRMLMNAAEQITELRKTVQNQAKEITDLKHQNRRLTKKLTNIANHRQRNKEKRENKFRNQESQT